MRHKKSRRYGFTLAFVSIGVLLMAVSAGLGAKKGRPPQWEWTVAIADKAQLQLLSDGMGTYTDTGHVSVRVNQESKNAHRFRLRIDNTSDPEGRKIRLRNVELDPAWVDLRELPGHFPDRESESCLGYSCDDGSSCGYVFHDFLNGIHPYCGYAFVALTITVSLDIEGMALGEEQSLDNGLVVLYVHQTDAQLSNPAEEFHNMDARNLLTGPGPTGNSPLKIVRTELDTWRIWVDWPDRYFNYAEFYVGYLRKQRWDHKYAMVADGSFNFETTWTRKQAN